MFFEKVSNQACELYKETSTACYFTRTNKCIQYIYAIFVRRLNIFTNLLVNSVQLHLN